MSRQSPAMTTDPVCGMQVPDGQFEAEHLGIRYSFCSEQCHARFVAHPHLYVGLPGRKAPKQEGMEVILRRRLRLSSPLLPEQATVLADALREMMGIKAVLIEADRVDVTYDLLQATAEQIEARIGEVGARLGEGWAEALRLAFVHYVEECTVGSLEVHAHQLHHLGH